MLDPASHSRTTSRWMPDVEVIPPGKGSRSESALCALAPRHRRQHPTPRIPVHQASCPACDEGLHTPQRPPVLGRDRTVCVLKAMRSGLWITPSARRQARRTIALGSAMLRKPPHHNRTRSCGEHRGTTVKATEREDVTAQPLPQVSAQTIIKCPQLPKLIVRTQTPRLSEPRELL